MKKPKTYAKNWPYYQWYKGYELEIFRDGSVNIVKRRGEEVIHTMATHGDLTAAFVDIDKTVECLNKKEKMFNPPNAFLNMIVKDECVSLGTLNQPAPCQTTACNTGCYNIPTPRGNNPMYVDNDKHIESSKINYLTDRAASARYAAQDKIEVAFNLRKPAAPQTPEELVTAITSGNYTIPAKAERNTYDRVMNQIVWRAPTVVADPDGADAAKKVFETLYKSAQDAVMIATPTEALTAVQALDAWTPTVGTVAS